MIMRFSSKQESDYDSQLEQIAGEVDSYIVKTDGALESFREQIKPLAQRWKIYYEAVNKRKKELLDYWGKVKKDPKLQDKNTKSFEGLEWDRFYLMGLGSFGSNPINEMPAKYALDVIAALEKCLEGNKEKMQMLAQRYGKPPAEFQDIQKVIAEQRQNLDDIRSEFDKLDSAEKKTAWIKTPPKRVIPNKIYEQFTWWRYLNLPDEDVFGCWRPPLVPLPEYPLEILKPVESGYQRNQTRKELPKARNKQEEYERYYIFLSSAHDNFLQGVEKITEGIWSDELSRAVLCCLDKGHGDKTAFLKAALERICKSNRKTDNKKESLKEIIGVLKAFHKDNNYESAISALPSIAETYEIICRSKDKCGAKTTDVIGWLSSAVRDNSGYYPALLKALASLEVIADFEKWQEKPAETEREKGKRKKFYKTWQFWTIIAIIAAAVISPIVNHLLSDKPADKKIGIPETETINETENALQKPIVAASATVEVKIKSDLDVSGIAANVKAYLVFVKEEKPLLITSSIGYTENQTGNDEVVYKAKLDMDANDSAVGNPASFLRDTDYILIKFGKMPPDSNVLGGNAICTINNSVRLKFSIPPQKIVNNRILISDLTESLRVLSEQGN